MRRATLTFTFGAALSVLAAPAATAMGFGRTVTATTLGQPLNFFANVALDVDESLARECVGADVLIGDARVAAENVRVTLESARDPSERRVRVTTRTIVDEPVVTVDVRVGCNSQMTKRFVAFVDPPMLHLASADAEPIAPQRIDPQVAPLLDIVRAADASRRRGANADTSASSSAAAESHRAARRAPGRQFAANPALARGAALHVAQSTRPRAQASSDVGGSTVVAAVRSAPRLRLEAASGLAAVPSTTTARTAAAVAPPSVASVGADSTAAQLVAAQAAATAASTALGQERDRMQALEAGLARVRMDTQTQQQTLGALQARLKQAEGARYANGLVYTLAGGMLLFALLAGALYALRPRQRRRARWFDAAQQQRRTQTAARSGAPAEAGAETVRTPAISQHPSQWNEGPPSIGPLTAPASIGGLEVTTVLAPQSHYARAVEAASANSGPPTFASRNSTPSMEQLIDLEQQAEFFVVLGQDEAAIALLSAHLDEAGGGSPLPYLQLLEIHQRREDRDSYERVRRSFHRHFNAYAPEWSSDLHFGRALDEYPQAIARLQALWPTPLHAMQSLDSLLFRRTEADETFDFPAYRDLLFLYSIARELAGNVETDLGSIDLFLPLDDTPTEPNLRPPEGAGFAVDLDVSSWTQDTAAEGLVVRRSVGRRGAS
jgi:pilus assembly protein FimV